MGSGSFPLENSEDVEKLEQACCLITEVIDNWSGSVYSGDSGGQQYDNFASDGAYLENLYIAKDLIYKAFKTKAEQQAEENYYKLIRETHEMQEKLDKMQEFFDNAKKSLDEV